MIISATTLLLTAMSAPLPADITPASLAVEAPVVELGDTVYDWTLQQGRSADGARLADNTANCNTAGSSTNINGHSDYVHDCGFD